MNDIFNDIKIENGEITFKEFIEKHENKIEEDGIRNKKEVDKKVRVKDINQVNCLIEEYFVEKGFKSFSLRKELRYLIPYIEEKGYKVRVGLFYIKVSYERGL